MQNNTLIYEKDFLSISHKNLSVQDFITLSPVHCQRLEEPRHKSVKKLLSEKLLPTHLEVAVVISLFEDEYYKLENPYTINGNTRKYIWNRFEDLRPNKNLDVTIYYAKNRDEIEKIYRSIDSSNSVESSGQLIGGLFRSSNYVPKCRKIKNGSFSTAMRHAYSCCNGKNRIYGNELSVSDISGKIEFNYFLEEIKFLDRIILSYENDSAKNKKYSTGPIMASILIISKKYGVDNEKLYQMIDHLINNKVIKHEGVGGLNDGISVINMDLFEKYNGINNREWSLQSEGFGPIIIGNLIYCMEAFMNDNFINVNRQNSTKGIIMKDDAAILYMRNFFNK